MPLIRSTHCKELIRTLGAYCPISDMLILTMDLYANCGRESCHHPDGGKAEVINALD